MNQWVTILASLFIALSGSGVLVALINRKNRKQRDEELRMLADQRRKIKAETDELVGKRDLISIEAAQQAVKIVRNELDEAHKDIDKRDGIIERQSEMIEGFRDVVSRQNLRIGQLEWWTGVASQRFERLGVTDMPPVPHTNGAGPR